MPLLEETGHMPTEKYAHAPGDPRALPAHREAVRPLRQRAVPHRGHRPRVGRRPLALDRPHQPRRRVHRAVPRRWAPARCTCRSSRASPASRTSRATRSTPAGGTTTTPAATRRARRWTSLADKRVAIIGTGATSVQCVPAPGHGVRGALRLPAHAVVGRRARQPARPTPSGSPRSPRPGWQQRWLENFTANQTGGMRRGGPRDGRLDRPRPPHPQPRSWRCRPRTSRPRR